MNIHLIRTPEYAIDDLTEVLDLLKVVTGPMKFNILETPIDNVDVRFNEPSILKWEEIFSYCNAYRQETHCPSNDFVVLLTPLRNEDNWFSRFDQNRNIYVHTGDWELFTTGFPKYAIAYQVIENILQSLMNLGEINNTNPYIHAKPKGCINDLCPQKEDIMLKLRTADICTNCFEKLKDEVLELVINQAFKILEGIRVQLLFRTGRRTLQSPSRIFLNENDRLVLPDMGNDQFILNALCKTLYLFYLKHPEGVRLNELCEHRNELFDLYKKFTRTTDDERNNAAIDRLIDATSNSFSENKSIINRIINEKVGEEMGRFYRIEGERGEPFKINLPQNLLDIRN